MIYQLIMDWLLMLHSYQVMLGLRPTAAIVGDSGGIMIKCLLSFLALLRAWYYFLSVVRPRRAKVKQQFESNCPNVRINIHGQHRNGGRVW